MKKILACSLLILALNSSLSAEDTFTWAEVGVNGLTCSMCSRSVEMSLRKLSFVDSVAMNLEHTEGRIFFKKNAEIDIDKIAKAVVDAGFSVRYLKAGYVLNKVHVVNDYVYDHDKYKFHFLKVAPSTLTGEETLVFIGPAFMPAKEFKQWKSLVSKEEETGVKTYFVTL